MERENHEEDWDLLFKVIRLYAPEHFNLKVCNFKLYQRCATFVATRCFGWGLPTTFIAPIADCFNHSATANHKIDIVNRKLHKDKSSDLYMIEYDFKSSDFKEAERLSYNVKDLYTINRTLKKELVRPSTASTTASSLNEEEEKKGYEFITGVDSSLPYYQQRVQEAKNEQSLERFTNILEATSTLGGQ